MSTTKLHHLLSALLFSLPACADGGAPLGERGSSRVPCAPSEACIAHMAEWPMPGSVAEGKAIPYVFDGLEDETRETVYDRVTRLEWQRDIGFDDYSWEEASRYCAALTLDGRDDFRLPTRAELDTVLDPARARRDVFGTLAVRLLWTSTPMARLPGQHLMVGLHGLGFYEQPEYRTGARCVRWAGPPRADTPRYAFEGWSEQPITRDQRTGLRWQQRLPSTFEGCVHRYLNYGEVGSSCTRSESIAYCENLDYGGFDDWRLPNLKEALTLFDPDALGGLSATGFPGGATLQTWTTTLDSDSPGWAFKLEGALYGSTESEHEVNARPVRCVR